MFFEISNLFVEKLGPAAQSCNTPCLVVSVSIPRSSYGLLELWADLYFKRSKIEKSAVGVCIIAFDELLFHQFKVGSHIVAVLVKRSGRQSYVTLFIGKFFFKIEKKCSKFVQT